MMTDMSTTRRRAHEALNGSRRQEAESATDAYHTNGSATRNGEHANPREADSKPATAIEVALDVVRVLLPQCLAVGVMLGFIFGGCCSNVYALESIIQVEPESGTLLTFVQFIFVAVTGYIEQFDSTRPPFFIRPNKVPLSRWIISVILFCTVNIMNNHAFSYNISVPVHIILRSGGSISTIAAGYLWGKRYPRIQIFAVILLTIGVITAAWSDAQTKDHGKADSESSRPTFGTGLVILFVAQTLSAVMGIYTEETYKVYGPQWRENLFYSHLLSLPLFLPFAPSLIRQFRRLAASAPLGWPKNAPDLLPRIGHEGQDFVAGVHVPIQLVYLVTNVLTQYACIRGVNLLAAVSSALTVTIVLNIRKLVSLLLSIWLFGNRLAPGTLVGAVVVFGAGALYSLGARPKPKAKPKPKPEPEPELSSVEVGEKAKKAN